MKFNLILSCFVAILALVNPIQKVLIVTSLQERFSPTELRYISIKSTITAMLILIFFLYLGQVTFSYVFRVELYSFQITCGAVLMYNGLSGLLCYSQSEKGGRTFVHDDTMFQPLFPGNRHE